LERGFGVVRLHTQGGGMLAAAAGGCAAGGAVCVEASEGSGAAGAAAAEGASTGCGATDFGTVCRVVLQAVNTASASRANTPADAPPAGPLA
jgi:hypothetical protein